MMSVTLRSILPVLVLTAASAQADAWRVETDWQDPFVGEVVTAAAVTNDDGYTLHIFRSEDDRVRAVYALPPSTFDRLLKEGLALMIRPGNLKSVEMTVSMVPDKTSLNGTSNGTQIRAVMWHGQEPSPTRGTLRNILDSDQLDARFFLDNGGTVDTTWSLDGAPAALSTALGIQAEVDPDEKAWSELLAATLVGASQKCLTTGSDMGGCGEALNACSDVLIADRDKPGFEACMGARGY